MFMCVTMLVGYLLAAATCGMKRRHQFMHSTASAIVAQCRRQEAFHSPNSLVLQLSFASARAARAFSAFRDIRSCVFLRIRALRCAINFGASSVASPHGELQLLAGVLLLAALHRSGTAGGTHAPQAAYRFRQVRYKIKPCHRLYVMLCQRRWLWRQCGRLAPARPPLPPAQLFWLPACPTAMSVPARSKDEILSCSAGCGKHTQHAASCIPAPAQPLLFAPAWHLVSTAPA